MWDEVGQLYGYHGDVPVEVRRLKLTEEVGEVRDLAGIAFCPRRGLQYPTPTGRPATRRSQAAKASRRSR